MTESKVDPLDVLKADLKDDEHVIQIQGASRVAIIAKALGPQRARKDLIKVLEDFVNDENDEAMVAVGKQMAEVAKYVGGPEHTPALVPLLEKLIFQEETVVCDAAATSLATIISQMKEGDVEKTVMPALERMTTAEWFQPRVSVSKLLHEVYPKVEESSQEKTMKWFSSLCKDENPMVKKAALTEMGILAAVLGKNKVKDDIMAKLKDVCSEDSDLIRVFAVDVVSKLTKIFSETQDFSSVLWPVIQKLAEDVSWRVRKRLANALPEMSKTVGSSVTTKDFLPIFLNLLKDREPEVKIVACKQMLSMSRECKDGAVSQICSLLKGLVVDPNQTVRATITEALGELAELVKGGKDGKSNDGMICDLLKHASKDEDAQVRTNVLQSVCKVAKIMKSAKSLLPILQPFATDPKWRVRREYLRASTVFAGQSSDEGYDSKLVSNLIHCLSDHISSIREEACAQLAILVKQKGGEWGVSKLLPEALKSVSQANFVDQSNYIARMTGLLLVGNVSPHLKEEQIEKHVLPFVEQCLKDGVENVRFKAAKTLSTLIPLVSKKTVKEKLVPALEAAQKNEKDADILFYSEQALLVAAKCS